MSISLCGGRRAVTRRIAHEPAHFNIFKSDLGKGLTCEDTNYSGTSKYKLNAKSYKGYYYSTDGAER